jgi:hypothetical protein
MVHSVGTDIRTRTRGRRSRHKRLYCEQFSRPTHFLARLDGPCVPPNVMKFLELFVLLSWARVSAHKERAAGVRRSLRSAGWFRPAEFHKQIDIRDGGR